MRRNRLQWKLIKNVFGNNYVMSNGKQDWIIPEAQEKNWKPKQQPSNQLSARQTQVNQHTVPNLSPGINWCSNVPHKFPPQLYPFIQMTPSLSQLLSHTTRLIH